MPVNLLNTGMRLGCLAVAAMTPVHAWAESETGRAGGWTWPPLVVISLLLAGALYIAGLARMYGTSARVNIRWPSVACFALGWASLVLAVDSPIHEIGEQLFWVHMTQHEILMLISAPLLVLGRPLLPFLYALSPSWRQRVANLGRTRLFRGPWDFISAPLCAWFISALALWAWHAPWLFTKAIENDSVHAAQHATFFLTALLFWWPLVNGAPSMGYGGALVYIFTTAVHTSILGALLTFARTPWYAPYATTARLWNLTPLEDQQLGGLIMWIPAGTLLLAAFLILLVKWMKHSQDRWQYTRMAQLSGLPVGNVK
jgi:putative membrane protein